jgi:hypothetical protein
VNVSQNNSGGIYKISEFLKSISGLNYSSQLPDNIIQKIVFGDVNVLGLVFWTSPKNPESPNWVVIKEGLRHTRDVDVLDLFSQFHLFGDHQLAYYDHGLKITHRQSHTELLFKFESRDYIYLRGTASTSGPPFEPKDPKLQPD